MFNAFFLAIFTYQLIQASDIMACFKAPQIISFIKKEKFFKKPVEREQYLVSGISISTEAPYIPRQIRTKTLELFFLSLSENIITRGAPRHFCAYLNKTLRLFHSLKD
jgi:hypothetical protein